MDEEIIKIEDIVNVFLKRWKMIFSITIIATLVSALISFYYIAPKYEANTKLFIGKENSASSTEESYSSNDVQMYQKLLKTYAEVIQTRSLIDNAIDNSFISEEYDVKSSEILGNLTITPRADTQILEISYVDTDSQKAASVVEILTDEFIDYSTELIPNANVKIIENVRVPEEPISPNKKLNIAIAFILGFMVSAGLSFLLEFLDNTFRSKDEMEKVLGLPVIGAIPDELDFE